MWPSVNRRYVSERLPGLGLLHPATPRLVVVAAAAGVAVFLSARLHVVHRLVERQLHAAAREQLGVEELAELGGEVVGHLVVCRYDY